MKKIIIIGGGIAGLSAGIHAQQYGFESTIYEKHSIVGGQCTGWDRKGYHIDGCIHWLTGTKEGSDLNKLWRNVGALGDIEIIQLDNFGTYEFDGVTLTLWKDLDRLQKEWTELSSVDAEPIAEFVRDIRLVQTMEMPADKPMDMLSIKELLRVLKSMKGAGSLLSKLGKMGCEEYAKRFQHPALQKIFAYSMPEGFSIVALIFGMATFSCGDGAIPKDGSRAMALRMEKRYKELGGKVVTNAKAEEILINKEHATGVRFSDGNIVEADYVVAANDVKYTFDQLLKGNYKDKKFEMRFSKPEIYTLPTSVQVAFGVTADLKNYPSLIYFSTKPFEVAGIMQNGIGLKNYAYESSFAPEGNTLIISSINQIDRDYLYWEKLAKDKAAYKNEKQRIGQQILERIEERYPELKGKITLLDVATPMTYHRYANAYHGAWMSFMMTTKSKRLDHSGKIKGLKNVYLTGQWLQPPGGLPVAVVTGKFTLLRICKQEGCLKQILSKQTATKRQEALTGQA